MKPLFKALFFSTILFLVACDELDEVLTGLSDTEIVAGLKEALNVGTESSVNTVSVVDGYLQNEIVKILLPPEVQELKNTVDNGAIDLGITTIPYSVVMDAYVALSPNLDADPFEELITAMNRGAESAANKAKPIFVDAITGMSITDGLGILQGGERAATDFFVATTSDALIEAFQPDISSALGDTQALAIYTDLAGFINYGYDTGIPLVGTINVSDYIDLGVELPESIESYSTQKAVDGLFYFVGEEEKAIRADPFAYGSAIIERVFGSPEAQGN